MTDRDGYLMFQPKGLLTKKDEHELFYAGIALVVLALAIGVYVIESQVMDKAVEFISTFIVNLK